MSRSRELLDHIQQLQDVRNILNSMKNLALMETGKLSRFLQVQRQVVEQIHTVEVKAKLEKPVNFLANWRQNKGIRRGVSGAYLL